MNRLQTIDADTLQSTAYEPVSFVVDDLLPQGLHLLAGAPKIGKSWLALWLCLCAAQANRSGRSPRTHAEVLSSSAETASNASKAASLISRRTHRPRCTSPSCPSSSITGW